MIVKIVYKCWKYLKILVQYNHTQSSERFYKLRKECNYTQYKLGKLLNISRSTISKYESGDLFPATHTLIKIARVFKVSVDYLIGLSDER